MTPAVIRQLLVADARSWSATTISASQCTIIIHNTAHRPERQESDVMHELAHLLCEHQPSTIVQVEGFPFPLRSFDPVAEDEASWLGACLQLPRAALWWGARRGMAVDQFVDYFGASEEMVRYRRQITGVDFQLARARTEARPGAGRY
jgi:Zn-dependent peptidase ImmA (M78 family)